MHRYQARPETNAYLERHCSTGWEMSNIGLVHLVWRPLGLAPFKEFIESYRRNSGGLDHDLRLVFNGFRDSSQLTAYHQLLGNLAYSSLMLPHPVQDIPAYFAAAEHFDCDYLCFLNSHSVILDERWLAKMVAHVGSNVGLVGATGSYESHHTDLARAPLRKSRYWGLDTAARKVNRQLHLIRSKRDYFPYPNPHIRTNAFLISRRVMRALRVRPIATKADAHRFESGKQSLTRQIFDLGLRAVVVGVDGLAYEKESWHTSRTFRSGEQCNLLVSDNRTRQYQEADPETRRQLSRLAWGDN